MLLSVLGSGRRALLFLLPGVLCGYLLPMLACGSAWWNGGGTLTKVFTTGREALGVSVRLAFAGAAAALVLAGIRIALAPRTRGTPVLFTALTLLALPASFVGAGFLALQLELPAASGLPALVLAGAYTLRFLYVPLRLAEDGLAALPAEWFDAAAAAGQSRFASGFNLALPLLAPQLAAGAALVFVLGLSDIALATRLAPPGSVPATVWLFQQQHLAYDEAVFGLSLPAGRHRRRRRCRGGFRCGPACAARSTAVSTFPAQEPA